MEIKQISISLFQLIKTTMKSLFNKMAAQGFVLAVIIVGSSILNAADAQAKKTKAKKVSTVKKVDTDSILVPPPPPPPTVPRKVKKVKAVKFTPPRIVKDSTN